jgi:hypothetical protein
LVLLPYLPSSPSSIEDALTLCRRIPDALPRLFVEVRFQVGEEGEEGGGEVAAEAGCHVESIRVAVEDGGKPWASWVPLSPSLPRSVEAFHRRLEASGRNLLAENRGKGGRNKKWRAGRELRRTEDEENVWTGGMQIGVLIGATLMVGFFYAVGRRERERRLWQKP